MGYRYQFITLAGFHALNHSMFDLARGYAERGMSAYVELQDREFGDEENGYTATKHQREVGAGYFDLVSQATVDGCLCGRWRGCRRQAYSGYSGGGTMRNFYLGLAIAAVMLSSAGRVLADVNDDRNAAQQIAENLKRSGELKDYRVGVKYEDGVAWLMGTVTSQNGRNQWVRVIGSVKWSMRKPK